MSGISKLSLREWVLGSPGRRGSPWRSDSREPRGRRRPGTTTARTSTGPRSPSDGSSPRPRHVLPLLLVRRVDPVADDFVAGHVGSELAPSGDEPVVVGRPYLRPLFRRVVAGLREEVPARGAVATRRGLRRVPEAVDPRAGGGLWDPARVGVADVAGDVLGLVVADHRVEGLVDVGVPAGRLVVGRLAEAEHRGGEHLTWAVAEVLGPLGPQRAEVLLTHEVDEGLADVGVRRHDLAGADLLATGDDADGATILDDDLLDHPVLDEVDALGIDGLRHGLGQAVGAPAGAPQVADHPLQREQDLGSAAELVQRRSEFDARAVEERPHLG